MDRHRLLSHAVVPAIVACVAGFAAADDLVVLGTTGEITTFDVATGAVRRGRVVKGLGDTARLEAIDARPSNGRVYGLKGPDLYEVDLSSGWATRVGPGALTTRASQYGTPADIDFDPVRDVVRVTRFVGAFAATPSAAVSYVIDPDTGETSDVDPTISEGPVPIVSSYAAGDVNAGKEIRYLPIAFANSVAGAQTTLLFGIDVMNSVLVRVGPESGPAGGPGDLLLTTIAPLGDAPGSQGIYGLSANGFDIAADGTAYTQILEQDGDTARIALHRIDLATGERSVVQRFPVRLVQDLTVVPSAVLQDEEVLGVTKMVLRRDLERPANDTLELAMTLPATQDVLAARPVRLQVSSGSGQPAYYEIQLDDRGRMKAGNESFGFGARPRNGRVKFTLKFTRTTLGRLGLGIGQQAGPVTQRIDLHIAGRAFHAELDVQYRPGARRGVATFKAPK